MEKIRSFIAIELDEEIKQTLASLIEKLKASGADVKWVKPENIHLTLKFLGHISKEKIDGIKRILDNAKDIFKPFRIILSDLGAFPKPSYPRVIWVGIKDGENNSKKIYDFMEKGLEKIGFQKEERPFSPHLTIGRVKSPKNRESLKSNIENLKNSLTKSLDVGHITLFQSTLTPGGPIYTPLYKAKLGN